jgi:hypothetical protein
MNIQSFKDGENIVPRVGTRVSAIEKFQITNYKYQTNANDRSSKFQTIGL